MNVDRAVPEPAAFSTHSCLVLWFAARITVMENTDLDLTIQTNVSYAVSPLAVSRWLSSVQQWSLDTAAAGRFSDVKRIMQ